MGLPAIAPMGGAAEEVVDPASAVLVAATCVLRKRAAGVFIDVDVGSLAKALDSVLRDTSVPARRAISRGPLWAARHLSMQHSADALLAQVMLAAPSVDILPALFGEDHPR